MPITTSLVKSSLDAHKLFAEHYYKTAVNQKTNNTTLKTIGFEITDAIAASVYEKYSKSDSYYEPMHKYIRETDFTNEAWLNAHSFEELKQEISARAELTQEQIQEGYTDRWTYPDYVEWNVYRNISTGWGFTNPDLFSEIRIVTNKTMHDVVLNVIDSCRIKNTSLTQIPSFKYMCWQSIRIETGTSIYEKDTMDGNVDTSVYRVYPECISPFLLDEVRAYEKSSPVYSMKTQPMQDKTDTFNELLEQFGLSHLTALTPSMKTSMDAFFDTLTF